MEFNPPRHWIATANHNILPPGYKIELGYDSWSATGRIDSAFLAETAWSAAERPLVYICGPTGFVEAIADALVTLGHDPSRIRTERFGPT